MTANAPMTPHNEANTAGPVLSVEMLVGAMADHAIYMVDAHGIISDWNGGAQRIIGYAADDVLGRHFQMFYPAEEQEEDAPAKALAAALAEGRFETQGRCVRKDGRQLWANMILQPVYGPGKMLIGFAVVTRDISEQRREQAALEAGREELHQSQKMEALGHLTGGIAHDFNNFLTAIIGNLEAAKSGAPLNRAAKRQIDAAMQAARNAAAVVRQMLVFARKTAAQGLTIDVNETIEDIAALIRRSANENIDLKLDLAADLNAAKSDPMQLQTSVLNMALNAIDAMPHGGVLSIATKNCAIRHHERLRPGNYVCIAVSDTGEGMPPEVLEHAFEPFFTTKELGKGTGLGLSMVYGAVQQLRGDIAIESEIGRGTAVTMILPAAKGEAVDALERRRQEIKQEETADSLPLRVAPPQRCKKERKPKRAAAAMQAPLHVLYVEDDFLVGLATIEILEKAGIDVQSAARAEEALTLLQDHPEIDVLLTDIGLPGMSGHELVAEARRRRQDIKVLFLTGYDRTGAIVGTEADLKTQYMDKPYEPEVLVRTVTELAAIPSC